MRTLYDFCNFRFTRNSDISALKTINKIIKGGIWLIIASYFAATIIIHIPYVQGWLGQQVSDSLESRLGTKVTIERIDLGFFNRIIVDGLNIYDRDSRLMIKSSRVAAKIDYYQLIKNQRIYISSAQIFGFNGLFYKKEKGAQPNYQFLIDALSSKSNREDSKIQLSINSLIIRHGAFKYDRWDIPYTPSKFNPNHIEINDLSAHFIIPFYSKEKLHASVRKLSFKEVSGLVLKDLSIDDLAYDQRHAELQGLNIILPNTDVHISSVKLKYKSKNGEILFPSVEYDGMIDLSSIALSDISCFMPKKSKDEPILSFIFSFNGDYNSLNINRLILETKDKAIKLNAIGRLRRTRSGMNWSMDIANFEFDTEATPKIVKLLSVSDNAIPDFIPTLGRIRAKGVASCTNGNISAKGDIFSEIGNIHADMKKRANDIMAKIEAQGIDLARVLPNKKLGKVNASIYLELKKHKNSFNKIIVDGKIANIEYNDYQYKDVTVKGHYADGLLSGSAILDDPNGQIAINGEIGKYGSSALSSDITVSVRNFNPSALNITDKWKDTSFNLDLLAKCKIESGKANPVKGIISVDDFSMSSPTDQYELNKLEISADQDGIKMQSDFGEAVITGLYDVKSITGSIKNILHSRLPSLFDKTDANGNRFRLKAEIKESDWLNKIFNIPLKTYAPITLSAYIDDADKSLFAKVDAPKISYDGKVYKNISLRADTSGDSISFKGDAEKVMDNGHDLRLGINAQAADDMLASEVAWDNQQPNSLLGQLNTNTKFHRDGSVGIDVKPSKIRFGDAVWQVRPASIEYDKGDIAVNHFSIDHGKQHVRIYGKATKSLSDSITVDLKDVDVNYVLNLVNFHSVEFGGNATGMAYVKSVFYSPDLYANLKVSDFTFQGGSMGELAANVSWNKALSQIDIDAKAVEAEDKYTVIRGNVSPSRNQIDLGIWANNTNIEFLEGFCGRFMDNVEAKANGKVSVHGPLDAVNLTGEMVADGNVRVIPINAEYTLANDTIRFNPDDIVFKNDTIRDRNGNIGIVEGHLRHKNLSKLTYDLNIKADNLLCYDTKRYNNETFYGTAFGTGLCSIRGGGGKIDIDINITPNKGSFIEYNVASPETVADQQFITWNDKTAKINDSTDTALAERKLPAQADEPDDIPSDMHINFIVNMTPDATLRVAMDNTTGDYIALNGTGSLTATYFNKGSFDMFGTYLVDHGIYKLTIQNLIKKEFQFQQGSSIIFGGNPYNAALNLNAVYTVNSVPLSDLQIGNSFSSNNVRVDCLMNIGGTPQAPKVSFDIDLPTLSNDAEQMVRTVINSEEEMNQQVVYLLGIGRFYVQKNNNAADQEEQQNQTSLAMQSFLSGTISQQINSLLGHMVKNNNWTFGANISTGNEGFNNAEYEGLLSGKLLNNRLVINGQFGYRDNPNATTSFIGDFDINYLLTPSGSIAFKVYNQTNDRYFTKSSLNTQGIGIMLKKDFNTFWDMFGIKRKSKKKPTSPK